MKLIFLKKEYKLTNVGEDVEKKGTQINYQGFPGGSVVKNLPVNVGDVGSIPVLGRSPEEGNGNPLEYSCLGNPMDKGAQQDTVYENGKKLDTTK